MKLTFYKIKLFSQFDYVNGMKLKIISMVIF